MIARLATRGIIQTSPGQWCRAEGASSGSGGIAFQCARWVRRASPAARAACPLTALVRSLPTPGGCCIADMCCVTQTPLSAASPERTVDIM